MTKWSEVARGSAERSMDQAVADYPGEGAPSCNPRPTHVVSDDRRNTLLSHPP